MKVPRSPGAAGALQGVPLDYVKFDSGINVRLVNPNSLSPYKVAAVEGTSTIPNSSKLFIPSVSFSGAEDVPTADAVPAKALRVEDELARLPPSRRWQYLFEHRKSQLFIMVMAVLAWLYAATAMIPYAHIVINSLTVGNAKAETVSAPMPQMPETLVSIPNAFLFFLGIFIFWSLGTVSFSKTADKIALAGDVMKTLLGFLVGYFSSPKAS